MILNIEKDTMLVQDYGFNGFQTHTLYHIQIIITPMKGIAHLL